jgi:hypothetical protein
MEEEVMTSTTSIRVATAALIVAGALSPVALAGGEPKNDLPFTRAVQAQNERTTAQAQSPAQVGLGEPKNQLPFTRPVASGSVSQTIGLAGEAKNDLPFTQPVDTPTIVVHSNGFDWGDAGIGVAAGIGLAAALAGGLLLTYRGSRGHKIGAAATR